MHDELADGRRLALHSSTNSSSKTHGKLLLRSGKVKPRSWGYLSVPGVVKDDGRVGVVAQKDGHEGGDELMAQCVPGGGDLQQR